MGTLRVANPLVLHSLVTRHVVEAGSLAHRPSLVLLRAHPPQVRPPLINWSCSVLIRLSLSK
jgi:hypothetical protein